MLCIHVYLSTHPICCLLQAGVQWARSGWHLCSWHWGWNQMDSKVSSNPSHSVILETELSLFFRHLTTTLLIQVGARHSHYFPSLCIHHFLCLLLAPIFHLHYSCNRRLPQSINQPLCSDSREVAFSSFFFFLNPSLYAASHFTPS